MDPLYAMTAKMSRKRRGEPRFSLYAEEALARKKRKMADSGTRDCHDHDGECIFPPARMCRGLNPTRERRDLYDKYIAHENAIAVEEAMRVREDEANQEEARLYQERAEAADALVELSVESIQEELQDNGDDADTVILGHFSPMSPDPNDENSGNGRPIYTPNMAEYSPTPYNSCYNDREFDLGGLTEGELEDIPDSNM